MTNTMATEILSMNELDRVSGGTNRECKELKKAIPNVQGFFGTRGGNYLRGTIIGHGEAHIAQSIGILKRAGYDGFVTVEFEGTEDNLTGIGLGRKNLVRFMELA